MVIFIVKVPIPRKIRNWENGKKETIVIRIKRLLCKDCNKSFSILPWFIPPHRSYDWNYQELAIQLFLNSQSIKTISGKYIIHSITIKRWLLSLVKDFAIHYRCLINFPGLKAPDTGPDIDKFWKQLLHEHNLKNIMSILHSQKIAIP